MALKMDAANEGPPPRSLSSLTCQSLQLLFITSTYSLLLSYTPTSEHKQQQNVQQRVLHSIHQRHLLCFLELLHRLQQFLQLLRKQDRKRSVTTVLQHLSTHRKCQQLLIS